MKNEPLLRDFWERIDIAIDASGKSKSRIAREMNVNRKSLMCRDNGMHSRTLAAFCAVTGADANWLLGLRRDA